MILCTWMWNAVQFYFFMLLSLDVQKKNQKVISIDIAFYFGHLLKLSRMCLKQDENFSKESYLENNHRFILKWIVKLVFLCCCELFAQVNANEHILYVRKKKITEKTKKKKCLSFF